MPEQRSDRDRFFDDYRQAIEASGLPAPDTIISMVLDINAHPERPPTDSALWPIFSFVRSSLEQDVPLNWLMAQGLDEIDERLLQRVEEEAFQRLKREDKIRVTVQMSLPPEEVQRQVRRAFAALVEKVNEQDPRRLAAILQEVFLCSFVLEGEEDGKVMIRAALIRCRNKNR